MKITQFKQIMEERGYIVEIFKSLNHGAGYTLIKGDFKYFISKYSIICLSDISYLNLEDFKF